MNPYCSVHIRIISQKPFTVNGKKSSLDFGNSNDIRYSRNGAGAPLADWKKWNGNDINIRRRHNGEYILYITMLGDNSPNDLTSLTFTGGKDIYIDGSAIRNVFFDISGHKPR